MKSIRLIFSVSLFSFASFAIVSCKPSADFKSIIIDQLTFNRASTEKLLDELEKTGKANEALRWRAGPGRAPIGWQIMHLAATEDRFGGKVLGSSGVVSEAWVKEYESGKPAPDEVPTLAEVRKYLKDTRAALEKSIAGFDLNKMDEKVPDTQNTYRRIFNILLWHEGHHHGQAHATFNLYKASKGIKSEGM